MCSVCTSYSLLCASLCIVVCVMNNVCLHVCCNGCQYVNIFDTICQVTEHPFASFKAKGDKFFIFHKMVKEEKLQNHLLEIQERKIG